MEVARPEKLLLSPGQYASCLLTLNQGRNFELRITQIARIYHQQTLTQNSKLPFHIFTLSLYICRRKEINRDYMIQQKKAVIIGAGIGGIATAAFLAQNGYAVEVYEKNAQPGGRCGQMIQNGHRFDIGATILLMPSL